MSLVPLANEHIVNLWKVAQGADESWTYLTYGPFDSAKSFESHVIKLAGATEQPFFAVVPKSSSVAEGWLSYCDIIPKDAAIEIGSIWFSPALQRTRAATEAIYLLLNHAFEIGYERIAWRTNELNVASRQAAVRLGFTYEGTWRHAQISKGHRRSTAWYSIISSDWEEGKGILEAWLADDNFDGDGQQKTRLRQT